MAGADLVVVPQAGAVGEWPDGLYEAEMRVAAFQNGYHVALCNRVGKEDCLDFAGESFVCDADGDVIARAPLGADHLLVADVDLAANAKSHARRLFLRHRRPELYGAVAEPLSAAGSRAGAAAHARPLGPHRHRRQPGDRRRHLPAAGRRRPPGRQLGRR